jgi:transcriptional regulator with XRE-family HTH domain
MEVIAFGALIKRKRGETGLSQEKLAARIWDDPARKSDISRLERGLVPSPQEKTIQYLCAALNISAAEMEPIRQSRLSAAQLDHIPTLSREELENIATRFEIEGVFDRSEADLRKLLTQKATEYRALKAEVDGIEDGLKRLSNLKAAAQDAIGRIDLEEVEEILSRVQEVEKEEAAKTAELRAENALLRGKVDQAYTLFCDAADSFAIIDQIEPARRRILRFCQILGNHGLRYGGSGIVLAQQIVEDVLTDPLKKKDVWLWAAGQNALAINLQEQGTRTDGAKGADLLAGAVTAYREALKVYTRDDHPADWAMTQNNLGAALRNQGSRTDGAKGANLLAGAVTAYRAVLKVYTHDYHPVYWAGTQNNLAIALQKQGTRTEGAKGTNLLADAVTAYRDAQKVYTRDDYPVYWADTQNNLGTALQDQGIRTDGTKGADLLAGAVAVYRAALEVRTRDDHPVQWATTQENIAIALLETAAHDSCTDPASALAQALTAVDAALTVYDPEHMSYHHAKATRLRTQILAQIAVFT